MFIVLHMEELHDAGGKWLPELAATKRGAAVETGMRNGATVNHGLIVSEHVGVVSTEAPLLGG
jgi:hypothetical protein